jgi:hypothetical protein
MSPNSVNRAGAGTHGPCMHGATIYADRKLYVSLPRTSKLCMQACVMRHVRSRSLLGFRQRRRRALISQS